MNILCIGDVFGPPGLDFYNDRMPALKEELGVDFVVVNGENSDKSGTGITNHSAEALLRHADVVTSGNHGYDRAGEDLYLDNERVIHPANYPYTEDSTGCVLVDTGRLGTVCVINLAGVAFLEPIDNPFTRVDYLLKKYPAKYTIVDFHAESTSEKKAMAYHLDGRISGIFGTHTHVQTADEQILPNGTGFITDAGMSGPIHSILGMDKHASILRNRLHIRQKMVVADGFCMINGVLFTLDDDSGLCISARRINLQQTSSSDVKFV